ncbi:unnamed protein product [Rotaria socialis]|uniref:Uncharacterized protein n=1 Tax=Rotaria socialis TaxID=392032 RepID=A0A819YVF8_9BILA|nr:unnamed protein product [Rotaria socialis]CAF3430169.1 unnamed protein product [Rotaria socialis]CAF3490057.1 unnamed protein product [Rotaria socialis]CAF3504011.1 unnamed protein product [Rotaria socialis]CAF4164002.1 unnamed protein product [Rotaria socialis]
MADSYDISRNPSDLPRSRGIANVRPGASRQHFLDFENMNAQQDNPLRQLTADSWKNSINEEKQEKDAEEIFSTEIDAEVYDRYALGALLPDGWSRGHGLGDSLKNITDAHCSTFYDKAMELLTKHTDYEEALVNINKCLLLKPYHIPFYEIRSQIYLNLCDFQSSFISLQKSITYTQATTSNSRLSKIEQPAASNPTTPAPREDRLINEKIAFLRYITGVTLFDQKLYLDALGIVANGASIFITLPFQIYSILCLTALNKIDEASTLVTQMIEQYPENADLLIIRARLFYKDKTKVFI